MDYIIYRNSLGIALPLLLFFAGYFLAGRTPDKPIFENYRRSRRIMGWALLILAVNYTIHICTGLRFECPGAAILLNLCTYFLAYWLFSAAFITLLDRSYLTPKRIILNLSHWLGANALSTVVLFALPEGGLARQLGIFALTAWLVIYGVFLARRVIRTYRQAVRIFDDTHSEDISAYIRWMYIFTWWTVIYGVSCALLTFLPAQFEFIWVLSSVPFYIYLFCSYMNYLLFYEKVETILEKIAPESEDNSPQDEENALKSGEKKEVPAYYAVIEKRLPDWISSRGYTVPGLTIEDLAQTLGSNRTYVSNYIKQTYNMSFREWIATLRIEYAKGILAENPEMTVGDICEATGFISKSYFIRIFAEKEGVSPLKWRKGQ